MYDGAGTDIVSVHRIAALVEAGGARFLRHWFSPAEIAHCAAKPVPSRHLAARVAAKEAVVKALALTWEGPLPWRSVEIRAGERGQPSVRLSGRVREAAERAGVRQVLVSIAHCGDYATAIAFATSADRT
jgi:phosphopantetheine--protein transferase-like protein